MNLKFKDGNSVAEHLSDFQSLVNQLAMMKMVLDDEFQALLLLSSLHINWETWVVSLSNSAPNGKLTLDMVKDSMFNEESRRKDIGSDQTQALVIENKGMNMNRGSWKGSKSRSKSRNSRGKSQSKGGVICYHCNTEGHIRRNCRIWKREQKQANTEKKSDDKNTTVTVSEDVVVLSFEDEECLHVVDNDVEWVIDKAASYHTTPRREFFTSYKAGDFGTVKMGNTNYSKIVGIGGVCIRTSLDCTLTLKDVRHVPDLRLHLISGVALDKMGYDNHFGNGKWKLTKGSLVVAKGGTLLDFVPDSCEGVFKRAQCS